MSRFRGVGCSSQQWAIKCKSGASEDPACSGDSRCRFPSARIAAARTSPPAGAYRNHGPIIGAPVAPHIAAPVPAEICVRIAIFRMRCDGRRGIDMRAVASHVRLVTNCVRKCAGAGKRERQSECHCRKFQSCLLRCLGRRQPHHYESNLRQLPTWPTGGKLTARHLCLRYARSPKRSVMR